ncbi:MAG: response regulator transcription factor [Elusimicrobia bacterium]|nr:response regulator transcription factor [Elusimicrobiota bacterium]
METRRTILLVDDDADSRRLYGRVLERAGYAVLTAATAEEALETARARRPDLILSDVQMAQGGDGFALCAEVRRHPRTAAIPIVLMSGLSLREEDQLEGLDAGADDYLLKPFSPKYLTAKTAAVLRRFEAPRRLAPALAAHGLVLDVAARTARLKGGPEIRLTRKEFDLLTAFLERPGRVLSAQFLLESVWGYDLAAYNDPHTVAVHLSSLRRKLGPKLAARIVTVAGSGYRFDGAALRTA